MAMFHSTLSLGRSDTVIAECSSYTVLLDFFKRTSKAVVRNIKEIVFSKDFNINYISKDFTPGETYSKVIVQALTKSYSDTYILFNIKRSITEEDLQTEFKKLFINDEPIEDFVSITFYDKGDSPINYKNMYQIQYKRNSKTYIENFYGKDWESIYSVADKLIDGEITEIRKFVHYDDNIKKDDGVGYFKSVTALLYSDDGYRSLKIPKVDISISHDQLSEDISNTFKVFGKSINKDELKLKYS